LNNFAKCNAEQINFTEIASDTGIKLNTVRSYFEILSDTLVGDTLSPFRVTGSRKAVATPKFYFFDQGVVNALLGRFEVTPESELFGKALEQIIYQELRAFLSYNEKDISLSYWRTHSQFEVDFLLDEKVAIEVKSSKNISARAEKGLNALAEDVKLERKLIVCLETARRRTSTGVEIVPVNDFLLELWAGEVV
jgi:uncharacterized protein